MMPAAAVPHEHELRRRQTIVLDWRDGQGSSLRRRRADRCPVPDDVAAREHHRRISMPIQFIQLETGRPIEGASKGLTKLCELGFCTFDPATETVWIHEMARFQIGDALKGGDKRIKHVVRFFEEIENPHIKQAFFEKYGKAFQLPKPPPIPETESPIEGASKPLGSPIEATVTVTVTNTGTSVPSERAPAAAPDPDAELFRRGKEVLGDNAGGMIAKLKAAKGGKVALARAVIEQASTKQNAREYVAAAIKGGTGPPNFAEKQTNGFVARIVNRSQDSDHAASREPIDVTPNSAGGSSGVVGRQELLGGQ